MIPCGATHKREFGGSVTYYRAVPVGSFIATRKNFYDWQYWDSRDGWTVRNWGHTPSLTKIVKGATFADTLVSA